MNGMSFIERAFENGNILNSDVHAASKGSSWLLDGLLHLGKALIGFIAVSGETLEPIFVIVAICGYFILMAGREVLGKKLVSGSVIVYVACKVCGVICLD